MAGRSRQRFVQIIDKRAVAAIARGIIDRRRHSWNSGDAALRRMQPTLSRLANCQLGAVREATLLELMRLAPQDQQRLAKAISARGEEMARQTYRRWLDERIRALRIGQPQHVSIPRDRTASQRWREPAWVAAASARDEMRRAATRALLIRRIIAELRAEFVSLWNDFDAKLADRAVPAKRKQLAILRVLEPLLDSPESAGVERAMSELSSAELRRLIDYGMRRELIMLNRETNRERAQAVARRNFPDSGD